MTGDEDGVEPHLGRIRARGSGKGSRRYLQTVLRSVAKAGGVGAAKTSASHYQGSRIGRGSGPARVLAGRDRFAGLRARRVIVKARIVKLAGKGISAARAHLRYVQRDGVTREGHPGALYDAARDRADGSAFLERSDGDRHQFRFIVNAEDGAEYEDLKTLIRRLMQRVETDLGTRLDWVAVDHFNTGQPHTHIVVRGRDDTGRDLVIAREYMAHGFRTRASELVTLDLGPRTDRDIEERLTREVGQERLTSIDRALMRLAGPSREIELAELSADVPAGRRFEQSLRVARLRTLEGLGLATQDRPGFWRLQPGMETGLRALGERGDILKAMHAEMRLAGQRRGAADYAIYDVQAATGRPPLVGRLVTRSVADADAEGDRQYMVLDGVDGRVHWVEIGRGEMVEPTPVGSVLSISPHRLDSRPADRTIVEVAAASGGRYSRALHLQHDPAASADYIDAHLRRLEALRRGGAGLERSDDGAWGIAANHLDLAQAYELRQGRQRPVSIIVLSTLGVSDQVSAGGATWLDSTLIAETPPAIREKGFGRDVAEALQARRRWLLQEDLAREANGMTVYRGDMLAILRRRELSRIGAEISKEIGKRYAEAPPAGRIEGVYRRRVDLASGRFALIERSRDFTLVPWRDALERNLGKPVSGIVRGDGVSWSFSRQRNGPSMS